MSIEFYDDVIFPPSISLYALKGKRSRFARVAVTQAGFEQRKSIWIFTKRTYEAGMATRTRPQWQLLEDLFEVLDGSTIGCRLLDPTDSDVAQSEGILVQVAGDAFCLYRQRFLGAHAINRAISKPVATSVVLFVTRASVTSIVPAGSYTLDSTTGGVLFATGYRQVGDVYAWLGQFHVAVRFSTNDLDWNVQDRGGNQLLMNGSIPLAEIPIQPLVYLPTI